MVCAMPCRDGMNDTHTVDESHGDAHSSNAVMNSSNDLNVGELMLLVDCINSDLEQARSNIQIEEPIYQDFPSIDLSLFDDFFVQLQISTVNVIRGPPPWASNKSFTPALILTTQRFRI